MKNGVKFIIAALLIIAGMMIYKTYQDGGFANAKGVNVSAEEDVEVH